MKKPIHCIQVESIKELIGKKILCANTEQGLGYYGVLEGICEKTGKFLVKRDCDRFITRWAWIVEFE